MEAIIIQKSTSKVTINSLVKPHDDKNESTSSQRSNNIKWPEYWQNGVIKTFNSMGIMTTELSPASQAFVEFSKSCSKPILDVGCAFGAAIFPALENGAEVVACDIDADHLKFIQENIDPKFTKKLTILHGDFFSDVHRSDNSLSAINISQVLHFFKGEKIEQGIKNCFRWLQKDGKIFITVMTQNLGIYNQDTLSKEITRKKEQGCQWPGEVNQKEFARDEYKAQIPDFAHFLGKDVLISLFERIGFKIEVIEYFCFDKIPDFYKTNGDEYISLVAIK
jgi:SAM-dependent methyltransferase